MRKVLLPLVALITAAVIPVSAQVPTNGDCLGAIPVCSSIYSYTSSANGPGTYTDLPYQGAPSSNFCPGNCISAGESNSTWYIFTTQTAGNISFYIDPVDNNDDYDWALYNITSNGCSGTYGGGSQVSCNYCLNTGNTGPTLTNGYYCWGPSGCSAYNKIVPTAAGQTYALFVNNFSGSFNGYSINFGASTAGIVDNVKPYITSLTTPVICGANKIHIKFNENIRCSTITGGDFTLTGPGGPYTISYVSGVSCLVGGTFEDEFDLTVIPNMSSGGTYTLWLSGAVLDNCGNASDPANGNNSRQFTITAPNTSVAASVNPICAGSSTTLTASGATSYTWSGGLGTGTSKVVFPASTTTYTVYGVTGGCTSVSGVTVNVTPTPVGNILANPINFGTIYCGTYTDTKNNATTNCFGNNYVGQSSHDIYYRFTLPVARTVSISHCASNFDTYMYLLNSGGGVIASCDDNGPLCATTRASMVQSLAAGTYYVVSEGYGSSSGNLVTTISFPSPQGVNTTNPIPIGTLTCSAYSNIQNNNIYNCFANDMGTASDDIYYSFSLTSTTIVNISHCGTSFDTYMHLLNSSGTEIYSNDDNGPLCSGLQASLQPTLGAGTYYVVSEGYGSGSGDINTQVSIPTPSGGTINGSTLLCYGSTGVSYTVSGAATTTYYFWSVPAGASITGGQGTNSITVNWGTASSGNITCQLRNGPCTGGTLSQAVTVMPGSNWIGITSTDWFTPSNWCLNGNIPFTTTDVIIPNSAITPFDPNINAAGAVCRNMTIQAGGIVNITGTNPLSVYGNWSDAGVFNEATGVVNFVGSAAQSITTAETFYDLNLSNAAGLSVSAGNTVSHRLTLTSGALSGGTNLTIGNGATIERFTGSLAAAPTFGAGVNLIYRSTVSSGREIPSSQTVLQNLQMNTAANGIVTLTTPAYLNGLLTFTNGVIRSTATNVFVFRDNSTYAGAANNRFIDGPVSKIGDDAFQFPTGDIVGASWVWAPLAIADPGANTTDRFTTEYYFVASPNNWALINMCSPAVLDHTSGVEYWDINRNSGSVYPNVTLYWKDAQRSGITSLADLTTAHWEACSGPNKWVSKGGTAVGTLGPGGTGSITGTGFTSYSPVTFGAKVGNTNPLPVNLIDFAAECINQTVKLTWSTATETDNDYFTVERSPDLSIWDELAIVDGAGNSNSLRTYHYEDTNPYDGLSYYRLKQTDYNGLTEMFDPFAVSCGGSAGEPGFIYYPNPFSSEVNVELEHLVAPEVHIVLLDVLGNVVYDEWFRSSDGNTPKMILDLKNFAAGMYFIELHVNDQLMAGKIVKRP